MVIKENNDPAKDPVTGIKARIVEIYANTAEITGGISPNDYDPGSALINTQTGAVYLLTKFNDGSKEWSTI